MGNIERYRELSDMHPEYHKGFFFAFSKKQVEEGKEALMKNGTWKEGQEIVHYGFGMFATPEGIKYVEEFYENRYKMMREECDPQEVYDYEYENHESFISLEGDRDAMELCISIFGEEIASKIKRRRAFTPFGELIKR